MIKHDDIRKAVLTLKTEPNENLFNHNLALYRRTWTNPQEVARQWPNAQDQVLVLQGAQYFFQNYDVQGKDT